MLAFMYSILILHSVAFMYSILILHCVAFMYSILILRSVAMEHMDYNQLSYDDYKTTNKDKQGVPVKEPREILHTHTHTQRQVNTRKPVGCPPTQAIHFIISQIIDCWQLSKYIFKTWRNEESPMVAIWWVEHKVQLLTQK